MSPENATVDQGANRICGDEAACSSPDPWYNEEPRVFPAPGEVYETGEIPWGSSLEDAEILNEECCPAKGEHIVWAFQWMHPRDVAENVGMRALVHNPSRARELANYSWCLVESVNKYGMTQPIVLHDGLIEGSHRLWAALALGLEQIPVLQGEIVCEAGSSAADCSGVD